MDGFKKHLFITSIRIHIIASNKIYIKILNYKMEFKPHCRLKKE